MKIAQSRRTRALLITFAVGVVALPCVPASAQPAPDDGAEAETEVALPRAEIELDWATTPTPSGQWILPLDALGYGQTIVTTTADALVELDIPEAGGPTPSRFETTLRAADTATRVTITDNAGTATEFIVDAGTEADVSLELDATTTGLAITAEALHRRDNCDVQPRPELVRLVDSVILYDGTTTPAETVGEFFGAALGAVHFGIDPELSDSTTEAVLNATTRLAARYPGELAVTVATTAEAGDAGLDRFDPQPPFARVIELREQHDAFLAVEDGRLVIGGTGEELQAQITGLSDAMLSAVTADRVIVEPQPEAKREKRFGTNIPLADITAGRLRTQGAYHLELNIDLDQTYFGGPVAEYALRLGGIASPPPGPNADELQLSLWVQDELEDVVPVESDGRFDIQFTIPGERIGRNTLVRLVLDGVRECGHWSQWSLQLDSGSWVEATSGQRLPSGFGRFPQNIDDHLAVYPGRTTRELAVAAGFVGQLQDQHDQLITIEMVDRQTAIDARTVTMAVGPDADFLEAVQAPLNPDGGSANGAGATFELDSPVGDVAALQAFVTPDGEDMIVVDLPPDVAQDGLPAALRGARWTAVDGNVALLRDGALRGITGPEAAPPETLLLDDIPVERPATGRELFVSGFTAVAIGAGLAFLGYRTVRRVRRRKL